MRPASSSRFEAARVEAARASVQTAAKAREGMNNLFLITSPSLKILAWQDCPQQNRVGGKLKRGNSRVVRFNTAKRDGIRHRAPPGGGAARSRSDRLECGRRSKR